MSIEPKKKAGRPKKLPAKPIIDKAQLEKLLQNPLLIQAEIYKRSFYEFFKAAFKILEPSTEFVDSPIIKFLCDRLQQEKERIERGEKKTKNLCINIPPRTSKSLIVSICFPAWCWASNCAYFKFITGSATSSISTKLALDSRTLIQSDWYKKLFPEVVLADDANNKTAYETTKRGARVSTSVKSMLLGIGADIIIIDDANNTTDTESEIKSDDVQNWYDSGIDTRLNRRDIGIIINVQQRLSEDDLSGYLLEQYEERYEHICIPVELTSAVTVKPEILKNYYQDGLFCPIRFGHEVLNDLKKKPFKYSAQYLQQPQSIEGGLFKKESFNIITYDDFLEKTIGKKIQWNVFIDSADTDNKKNDPTAILIATEIDNQIYIREVKTVHKLITDLVKYIQELLSKYNSQMGKIHIEGKSSGKALINLLRTNTLYNVQELQPGLKSKYARAEEVSDIVDGKRVHLIQGAYVDNFIEQVILFRNDKNIKDDMVDTMVYCIKTLIKTKKKLRTFFT